MQARVGLRAISVECEEAWAAAPLRCLRWRCGESSTTRVVCLVRQTGQPPAAAVKADTARIKSFDVALHRNANQSGGVSVL